MTTPRLLLEPNRLGPVSADAQPSALLRHRDLRRSLGNRHLSRLARAPEGQAQSEPGRPIPRDVRRRLERSLHEDLGDVRVHTTQAASSRAEALGAKAFTVGPDISFGAGRYRPDTPEGLRLLAHEVAHVVQARRAASPPHSLVSAPDDRSERRADSFARRGDTDTARGPDLTADAPGGVAQRDPLTGAGLAVDVWESLGITAPLSAGLQALFDVVVASNLATSTVVRVPASWISVVAEYSLANPLDGLVLGSAIARLPTFHRGGWIVGLVPGALAMTLDRRIFDNGSLSLATYVHELVHVMQYGVLGIAGFLASFFGLSAATIVARWLAGLPAPTPQKSSPHEMQAWDLEGRFVAWHTRTKGKDPNLISV